MELPGIKDRADALVIAEQDVREAQRYARPQSRHRQRVNALLESRGSTPTISGQTKAAIAEQESAAAAEIAKRTAAGTSVILPIPGFAALRAGTAATRAAKTARTAEKATKAVAPRAVTRPAVRGAGARVAARQGRRRAGARQLRQKAAQRSAQTLRPQPRPPGPIGRAAQRSRARVTESAPWRTAGRVARSKPGRAVRTGTRVATAPVRVPTRVIARNPGKTVGALAVTPPAVGVPGALKEGSLEPILRELEGAGITAATASKLGDAVAEVLPGEVAQNIVRDAFDLPAQALPSVYLPAAAAVEYAATGNDSRARELIDGYLESGLLPAVVQGDPAKAVEAFKEHPLFSALEARGGAAVVGRTTGALVRRAGIKAAGTARAPLELGGGLAPVPRRYSPDLIEKGFQVAADRRRERKRGGQVASPKERRKFLHERVDRVVSEAELIRRQNRAEAVAGLEGVRPSKVNADVVSLAVQGIIRSPRTFKSDLAKYAAELDAALKAGGMTRSERRAARELHAAVKRAQKRANPDAVFNAAEEYVSRYGVAEVKLIEDGILNAEQARKAALIPFAVEHMGARVDAPKGQRKRQLLDADGNKLSSARIEAEMKRQGVDAVAFLTQRPGARGAGSFFRRAWPNRQQLPRARRSGEATRRGTYDASFEALVEQLARTQSISDAARTFDRAVREFAIRDLPDGSRFRTFDDALRVARDPEDFGFNFGLDPDLVPVRIAPYRAARDTLRTIEERFDDLDPSQQIEMETRAGDLLTEATRPGPGQVVLMPRAVVNRLNEHFAGSGVSRKAMQAITGTFKGTVLPTSTRWLAGNVIDVSMRSLLAGLGVGDYFLGRKLLRSLDELDPEAGRRLRAQATSGTHFASAENSRVHRDARQFADTRLAPIAAALGALRRSPGVKQLADLYGKYRDGVFAFNERFIEKQPQYAALGKEARREVQATTGKWHHALTVGDDALRDLAKGLLKTENQIKYAKAVEDVFGQWRANSPTARAFLVDYSPFGMWVRAAGKFVLWTMPAKHPIKTGILAAAAEMTNEERVALGLSHFAPERLPEYLQGSIPLEGGGLLPVQGYTSFGIFADPPSTLANTLLPQFTGLLEGFEGLDFKGDKLTDEQGRPLNIADRVAVAAYSQAEAFFPFLSQARRVAEQGGSSQPGSTPWDPKTTEGTAEDFRAGIERAFLPWSTYDPDQVEYLRGLSNMRSIEVPVAEDTSRGADPWAGEESSHVAPWREGASSDDEIAPWR